MHKLIDVFEQTPGWIWAHPLVCGGLALASIAAWTAVIVVALRIKGRSW